MICPAYGTVATPHTMTVRIINALHYAMLWNLVGFPSGIVPVDLVRESEAHYKSKTDDLLTTEANKVMQVSAGMPIAIQIAAKPYQDEVVLGVMKQIENIFQFHQHPL